MSVGDEVFYPIKDFENYQVSNKGKVKNIVTGRVLKPYKDTTGYLYVRLYKNKREKTFSVHYLVASTFLKGTAETVNHKDGNKENNKLSNLEWATYKEQVDHALANGLIKVGKADKRSRAVEQYDLDGNLIRAWDSINDIRRELNFNVGNISSCCQGKRKTANGYIWKYKEEK